MLGMNSTSRRIERNPLIVVKGNCEEVLLAHTLTLTCDEPSREVAVGVLFGLTPAFVWESNRVHS
jgi:hypothetical protein